MSQEYVRIQIRRDSFLNWQSVNPILANGEFSYDTTNKILKIGDGSTRWADLEGFPAGFDVDQILTAIENAESLGDSLASAGYEGTVSDWLDSLVPENIQHNRFIGRTAPDAHSIGAITHLQAALDQRLTYQFINESDFNALANPSSTTIYFVLSDPE